MKEVKPPKTDDERMTYYYEKADSQREHLSSLVLNVFHDGRYDAMCEAHNWLAIHSASHVAPEFYEVFLRKFE